MKRQFLIRILMLVIVISAAAFVVAAVRADHNNMNATEECAQEKEDCLQPRTHSEFLLESLTHVVLGR